MGAAIVSTILLWWRQVSVAQAVFDQRLAFLKDSDGEIAADLRETAKVLQTLAVQVTASIQSQGIVNLTTTKALDAIISQLDDHTRQIADHGATLGLMREFLAQVHGPPGPKRIS